MEYFCSICLETGWSTSIFKWFLDRNHTKLGLSQGFNRIIVRTDIVDSKNEVLGSLEIFLPLYTFLRNFIILGGVFVGLVYLIYYVLKLFLSQIARVASEPIAEIAGILESAGTTRELESINVESNIFEVNLLVDRFRDLSKRLSEKEAEQLKIERLDAIAGLSAQVAHDIRSPLAALEIMIADSPSVPQSNRMMITSSVGRIRDITNQLSAKNQQLSKISGGKTDGEATLHLLSPLIESLVTEKRIQYRSKLRVKIEANLGASSYRLFVNIPSAEFTCVLSNLIDNAVDAIGEHGIVTLTLKAKDQNIEVRIHDTGKGIPPEILATQ
jgi:signal transduction histidine kinase